MPVPRNTQCPKRGPGLTHTVEGDITCVHCGQLTTMSLADMIRASLMEARAKAAETPAPTTEEEPAPDADPAEIGYCEWVGGHWSTAIWWTPRLRKWFCREHYARIVEMSVRNWAVRDDRPQRKRKDDPPEEPLDGVLTR